MFNHTFVIEMLFVAFPYLAPSLVVGLLVLFEGKVLGRAREDMLATKLLNVILYPIVTPLAYGFFFLIYKPYKILTGGAL